MRFEGIWIQRGKRIVRSQERFQVDGEFAADYERLYWQGHSVLLVPGKGYRLDEVFFFETADEAQQFYQSDLSDFECFIRDEHEPCGFEEVSLYIDGRRVATKSCTPSTPPKVSHDRAEMKGNSAGVTIVQDEISEK
jgi:hypothetical protein